MSKPDRCVVRNSAYRRKELSIRERHNERKNMDYQNDDICPERASYNVHFKRCEDGYEQALDKMLADGMVSTHGLPKDPHVVDEMIFDVNTTYFEQHGGYEFAKNFYAEAYKLAVNEIGGEQYILSAVMHADERNKAVSEEMGYDVYHYHLHVVYVPVVQKERYFRKNNKDPELAGKLKDVITQISHSKKWPRLKKLDENGEEARNTKGNAVLINSYSLLQDSFYNHMIAAGYTDIERGERGSTAQHLTDLEYKTKQEKERADEMTAVVGQKWETAATLDENVEKKKKQLQSLDKQTVIAKRVAADFADIEHMGKKHTIMGDVAISPSDWEKISGLAKEGVKSRSTIADLKGKNGVLMRKNQELEKRLESYEGKSLSENMKYYKAMQRAPRRLAETVADIMKQPPEEKEHSREKSKSIGACR